MKSKNVKDKEVIQNASKIKRKKPTQEKKNPIYTILFGSNLDTEVGEILLRFVHFFCSGVLPLKYKDVMKIFSSIWASQDFLMSTPLYEAGTFLSHVFTGNETKAQGVNKTSGDSIPRRGLCTSFHKGWSQGVDPDELTQHRSTLSPSHTLPLFSNVAGDMGSSLTLDRVMELRGEFWGGGKSLGETEEWITGRCA